MLRILAWRNEPLVPFVLGAVALFGLDAALRPAPADRIHVGAAQIDALVQWHETRTGAPPSQARLQQLVAELVEDEALFRRGEALGMVRGDPIVRRRVATKLRQAMGRGPEPTEAELRSWYGAHRDEFVRPATMRVEQRFFGEGAEGRVAAAAGLRGRRPAAGLPLPIGPTLPTATKDRVAGWLGGAVADVVWGAEVGRWVGPVASRYGWHLVRVTARHPARVPAFADVAAEVARRYQRTEAEARSRAAVERLLAEHEVVIEWPQADLRAEVSR